MTLGGERFKVQAEGDGRHRVARDTKFGETNIVTYYVTVYACVAFEINSILNIAVKDVEK